MTGSSIEWMSSSLLELAPQHEIAADSPANASYPWVIMGDTAPPLPPLSASR